MVLTKQLERMFNGQDHGGGFDEIDGADVSKPKRVAEGWPSPTTCLHPSSLRWDTFPSSQDISLQNDLYHQDPYCSDGSLGSLRSCEEAPGLLCPGLLFPDGSKGPHRNHGPIGGPITSAIIGPEGGQLEICGNVLTIPRGAVMEKTKFELGLVWNDHLRPSFGRDCQMTSILSCQPSGLKFCKPVILNLPHCLEMNPCKKGNQIRPVLYSSHHLNYGKPEWTRCMLLADSFTFYQQSIQVKVHDFCYLVWAFEDDRPDIEAKKICIIPYASPIAAGMDQKIRLHIFDDVEAVKEKVKKEEEELGGKRLTSYHSYVLLKNWGNLTMKMTWNTVGWILSTDSEIAMPFREMWACDHNACELHFCNEGNKPDFKCNVDIQQEKNESKVVLMFAHDVQAGSPNGPRSRPFQERSEEILPTPREETRSTSFSSLQVQLPEVPPAPEIAFRMMSIAGMSNSPGRGSKGQHFAFAEGFCMSSATQIETSHQNQLPHRSLTRGEGVDVPSFLGVSEMDVSRSITPKDMRQLSRRDISREERATGIATASHNRDHSNAMGGSHSAFNQYFIQNMNVNMPEKSVLVESENVIPFQLKRQLSVKLHDNVGVSNWMHLSKYWKLDRKYDEEASTHYSPAFAILSVAEEKKIVRSLDDLCTALRAIGRDDCVDIVKKYMYDDCGDECKGLAHDTASDSDW